ncbi:hypothetical protein BDW02DRAFT_601525 [Decorospora gaudefroyi]|uniref:Uncharacterized protein n=1 Tax=Decorospora gaudefroyi TaxID=184978 RepID=A0A6A5K120_9PLEO|nr:hypothetical protein BDW02DRAFT_601525 [Decorospora gaudefroyi]
MKFNSLLVTAAGLLALAGAATINLPGDAVRDAPLQADAITAEQGSVGEYDPATGITVAPPGGGECAMYTCGKNLKKCAKACGKGPHCKPYCECKLHNNSQSLCRVKGCVKAPKDCGKWNKIKRDMDVEASPKRDMTLVQELDPCMGCHRSIENCSRACEGLSDAAKDTCRHYCECTLVTQDIRCKKYNCMPSSECDKGRTD